MPFVKNTIDDRVVVCLLAIYQRIVPNGVKRSYSLDLTAVEVTQEPNQISQSVGTWAKESFSGQRRAYLPSEEACR